MREMTTSRTSWTESSHPGGWKPAHSGVFAEPLQVCDRRLRFSVRCGVAVSAGRGFRDDRVS
jgi:hypothetical protein